MILSSDTITFVSTALLPSKSDLLPANAIIILGSAWRCSSLTQALALSKDDYKKH